MGYHQSDCFVVNDLVFALIISTVLFLILDLYSNYLIFQDHNK